MKELYESPAFEMVTFEATENFAVLSSFVDPSDNQDNDNEIDAGLWN